MFLWFTSYMYFVCDFIINKRNSKFQKSRMAAAAILKNPKTPYFGRGSNDFDDIWHDDAV